MHGTAPLLRAVAGAVHQSGSKIPHLEYHIHRRLSKTTTARDSISTRSYHKHRAHSTYISLGTSEYESDSRGSASRKEVSAPQTAATTNPKTWSIASDSGVYGNKDTEDLAIWSTAVAEQEAASRDTPATAASDDDDVKSLLVNMYDLLQERHPERILFGLLDDTVGTPFIRGADDAIFEDALLAIDSDYFIEPFKQVYRFMKPSLETQSTYRWVRPLQERFETFAANLDHLVNTRRTAGHRLTLGMYRHLLKCAGSMGDQNMASHLFKQMMQEDKITADLSCYNNFFEAVNWSNAFSKEEQFRLRVTPRILRIRGFTKPPSDLSGYRSLANSDHGAPSLRLSVLETFDTMIRNGLKGDEATFANLMIAMGRENDMSGVKSVLKSVWNVDVDLLTAYDEEEIESPTFYDADSPLRPSTKLLFTVVHVFGSNNEVELATTVMDYISRNYDLRIPEKIWVQLYEWAFVLALKRSSAQQRQDQHLGKVSTEVPEGVFKTMQDEPHNLQPSPTLWLLRARSRRDAHHLDSCVDSIRQAIRLVEARKEELELLHDNLLALTRKGAEALSKDGYVSAAYLDSRRKFILASLEADQHLQHILVSVRTMLQMTNWPGSGKLVEWERRRLPKLLAEFEAYAPNLLRVQTKRFRMEIHAKRDRNLIVRQTTNDLMRRSGVTRGQLDTEDHWRLLRGVKQVAQIHARADNYCFICERSGHSNEQCEHNPTQVWPVPREESSPDRDSIKIRRAGDDPSLRQQIDRFRQESAMRNVKVKASK